MNSAADDGNIGALQRLIDGLRMEVGRLRDEIGTIAAQAAAAQTSIVAHTAVCDERQRLLLERQRDHDTWTREQAQIFKTFMAESSADRAAIHREVQSARTEARDSAIKVMWTIITMGATAGASMAGFWLKAYGPHF